MVAVIKTGHSIHRILNYNENKVKEGVAECIGEGNYPIDADKMSFTMKLNMLLKQLELNTNVTRNSVHISLNFSPSDRELSRGDLMEIADEYMDKIGFGRQPYLVYQHHDAAHVHVHIVSIKVRRDGSRIDMNNIGRNQSETARKAIEKKYGLVSAEAQKQLSQYELKPVSVSRALYGTAQTKTAIQKVLRHVVEQYRFASLPELNAVLRQYNVLADRGSENSRVFQHQGLLYRILDTDGKPIGVPIKASMFYNKPTLKFLEGKFPSNEAERLQHKSRIKVAIDKALIGGKVSLQELMQTLEKQGIYIALRQNDSGLLYGITYVDHQTKCVFNGSTLGKQYSAKAIQERCLLPMFPKPDLLVHPAQEPVLLRPPAWAVKEATEKGQSSALTQGNEPGIMDVLLQLEHVNDYVPNGAKKRKKKRKNLNNNK